MCGWYYLVRTIAGIEEVRFIRAHMHGLALFFNLLMNVNVRERIYAYTYTYVFKCMRMYM